MHHVNSHLLACSWDKVRDHYFCTWSRTFCHREKSIAYRIIWLIRSHFSSEWKTTSLSISEDENWMDAELHSEICIIRWNFQCLHVWVSVDQHTDLMRTSLHHWYQLTFFLLSVLASRTWRRNFLFISIILLSPTNKSFACTLYSVQQMCVASWTKRKSFHRHQHHQRQQQQSVACSITVSFYLLKFNVYVCVHIWSPFDIAHTPTQWS